MTHFDPIFDIAFNNNLESLFAFFVLNITRSIGLLYGFSIITVAIGALRFIRIPIAFSISLPLWVSNASPIDRIINDPNSMIGIAIMGKEFLIGYAIGFLASLPFLAIQYAAAITDQIRGEGNPSFSAGDGEMHSSIALLYIVAALLIFFFTGNFIVVIDALYQSYLIWPLHIFVPEFSDSAAAIALGAVTDTLYTAIRITLPLLSVLLIIEIGCGVAGRIARPYRFYAFSFALKNIATLFALPIILTIFIQLFEDIFPSANETLNLLGAFFR